MVKKINVEELSEKEKNKRMRKSICGVGFVGIGEYTTKDENGNFNRIYNTWKNLIHRCYDAEFKKKHPTYAKATMCEEWLNFQNFARWYEDNYYEVDVEGKGCRMELDKDWIKKVNKHYSPETCVFAPTFINSLIINRKKKRGSCCVGVWKSGRKFYTSCSNGDRVVLLGSYKTEEEAFKVYKEFKEKHIKEVAEEFKDKIDERLYEAMIKYEIKIDD